MEAGGSREVWGEAISRRFIDLGRIYTPAREELGETLLDLIPAERDEPFLAVELGVGAGWLSAALLRRFPAARVLGLDGSPTMLGEAAATLHPFAGRFELRPFRLEDISWRQALDAETRCVVSSLVIHHLDGAGKRALYRDLHARLAGGGALLIADLVAPRAERARRAMGRWWEAEVRGQSLAFTGSLDAYQQFMDDEWNWYEHPDPIDMPATIPEHLRWLEEVGFTGVDVFWERAGHALYGGYKAPAPPLSVERIAALLPDRRALVEAVDALIVAARDDLEGLAPLARAALELLASDRLTSTLQVRLAVAALPWDAVGDLLERLAGDGLLHSDALAAAGHALEITPRTDTLGLAGLEARLGASADRYLRRLGLAALVGLSTALGGWDAARLARLDAYRADSAAIVAAAAQFTFPDEGAA